MKKIKRINCLACSSSRSKPFFTENNYTYVKCKDCGLVYIDSEINQNFEEESDNDRPELGKFEEGRNRLFKKEIENIKKIKPAGSVLDIGCAGGSFLNLMRKQGYDVFGIEPDKNWAAFALKQRKIPIFNGTLKNFKSTKKFDIITLWDVLEHVPRPDKELDYVSKYLKKDGLLFLRLPTAGYVSVKIKLIKIFKFKIKRCLDPPIHISFQTKKSLETILRNHGFEMIKIKTSRSEISSDLKIRLITGMLYHTARLIYFLSLKKINFVINYTVYAKKCEASIKE